MAAPATGVEELALNPEVSLLLEQLESEDTRTVRVALERLGRLGDRDALPALRDMLSHSDDMVSFFAKRAISKIEAASGGSSSDTPSAPTVQPASSGAKTPGPVIKAPAIEPASTATPVPPKVSPTASSPSPVPAAPVRPLPEKPAAPVPPVAARVSAPAVEEEEIEDISADLPPLKPEPAIEAPRLQAPRVTVESLDVASLVQEDLDNPFEKLLETGPWDMDSGDELLSGILDQGAEDLSVELVDDENPSAAPSRPVREPETPQEERSAPRRRQMFDPWSDEAEEEEDSPVHEVAETPRKAPVNLDSDDLMASLQEMSDTSLPDIEVVSDDYDSMDQSEDHVYDLSASVSDSSSVELMDQVQDSDETEVQEDTSASLFGIPNHGPFAELVGGGDTSFVEDSAKASPAADLPPVRDDGMPDWWKPDGEPDGEGDDGYTGKPYVPSFSRGRKGK